MKITNGIVGFKHVVKLEDYGVNRTAEVSLSFTVDDGEDAHAALNEVAAIAKKKVGELLGKVPSGKDAAAAAAGLDPKTVKAATGEQVKKAGARKDANQPANTAKPDPAAVEEPTDTKPAANAAAVVEEPAEEDFMSAGAPAAKEITDADLQAATTRKNAEIKNAPKIRQLMTECGGGNPPTLPGIPQDKRQSYLDQLAKLTA